MKGYVAVPKTEMGFVGGPRRIAGTFCAGSLTDAIVHAFRSQTRRREPEILPNDTLVKFNATAA